MATDGDLQAYVPMLSLVIALYRSRNIGEGQGVDFQ
jgi:hypothetical protein